MAGIVCLVCRNCEQSAWYVGSFKLCCEIFLLLNVTESGMDCLLCAEGCGVCCIYCELTGLGSWNMLGQFTLCKSRYIVESHNVSTPELAGMGYSSPVPRLSCVGNTLGTRLRRVISQTQMQGNYGNKVHSTVTIKQDYSVVYTKHHKQTWLLTVN